MGENIGDRYRVIQSLGEGGMGETFLAEDTQMPSKRQCVVKRLKAKADNPNFQAEINRRFQTEAATLEGRGRNHNQIPDLYAYFEQEGDFYLLQEFIQGKTLQHKIVEYGPLTEGETKGILASLLEVLQVVHGKGIIHRDIKPENIILREPDNKPVLIDFGAVRETIGTVVEGQSGRSRSIVIGTPGYMPPEQSSGRPVFSSDLYSLGLTAISLLTGRTPQELKTNLNTGELAWVQQVPNLSPEFSGVLNKAIQFSPRDRFDSAQSMLSTINSEAAPSASTPPGVSPTIFDTGLPAMASASPSSAPTVMETVSFAPSAPAELPTQSPKNQGRDDWLRTITMALLIGGAIRGAALVLRPQSEQTADTSNTETETETQQPSASPSPSAPAATTTPQPNQQLAPPPSPAASPATTNQPPVSSPSARATEAAQSGWISMGVYDQNFGQWDVNFVLGLEGKSPENISVGDTYVVKQNLNVRIQPPNYCPDIDNIWFENAAKTGKALPQNGYIQVVDVKSYPNCGKQGETPGKVRVTARVALIPSP